LNLRLDTLHFLLECLDLVPGLQSLTHDAKVKVFHENGILIHLKKNITGDFLPFENFAMHGIDPECKQMLGCLGRIPPPHVLYCRVCVFFIVRLVAVDVRNSMAQMTGIFTS
jgi:hypothetical protein